jgi:biotin synthase-related radical SAM superfamily protein
LMADWSPPPMDQYRRIQIARYLIDNQASHEDRFSYSDTGHIIGFGISLNELNQKIDSGEPFRTSGCVGCDGEVACNRPFANAPPGPKIRNYPFPPTPSDVKSIRRQLLPKVKKGDRDWVRAAATETQDSRV